MPRLSIDNRNFVVHLRATGVGYGLIVKHLKIEKGVTVTKTTVKKLCEKFATLGYVTDKKRTYKGKFDEAHLNYLDNLIKDDPSATSKELAAAILERYDIIISRSRLNVIRRGLLDYTCAKPRYCQMIREPNKVKRLEWSQLMIDTNEQFDVSFKY